MTLFAGQVLRIDQTTGEASATYLTVTDGDSLMQSAEAGTIWNLCGINMSAPPALDLRLLGGTLLDGSAYSLTALHFAARGKDFYVLPATFAPEGVASVTTSLAQGAPVPTDYFTLGQTIDDTPILAGQALAVRFNLAGRPRETTVADAILSDDDAAVQTTNETGDLASILFGPGFAVAADVSGMVLVKVFYHGTTTNDSFTALRVALPTASGTMVYYLPRTGSVDPSDVVSFTRERALTTPADGALYADFGLSQDRFSRIGTAGADFLQGTLLHDALTGDSGADSLTGGLGADRLEGGADDDALHGGAQNDTLIGGTGNDGLFGGNDDDSLFGNDGDDTFLGAWGDDILFGGNGNDRLGAGSDEDAVYGGSGNDSLIGFEGNDLLQDGIGTDTLNGGDGADVFVLVTDGATDRIVDFQDGLDRIDLEQPFASLVITNLGNGRVQIVHGGEMLLIEDPTKLLTAADLTSADFL